VEGDRGPGLHLSGRLLRGARRPPAVRPHGVRGIRRRRALPSRRHGPRRSAW
jgi:hypothetical protein